MELIVEYAIVYNNTVKEIREHRKALTPDRIKHINGIPVARPVVTHPKKPFNDMIEKLVYRYEIFNDRVEVHWDIVPLTNHEKILKLQGRQQELEKSELYRLLFLVCNVVRGQLPQVAKDKLTNRDQILTQIQALGG
jgi:hypothetical protein